MLRNQLLCFICNFPACISPTHRLLGFALLSVLPCAVVPQRLLEAAVTAANAYPRLTATHKPRAALAATRAVPRKGRLCWPSTGLSLALPSAASSASVWRAWSLRWMQEAAAHLDVDGRCAVHTPP